MSEPEKFEIGEVVCLKSGGPKMTVDGMGEYSEGFRISCVWFEGSKKFNGVFHPATLEKF
jgi:uncharacterized protein YodC (DUF2158 family)